MCRFTVVSFSNLETVGPWMKSTESWKYWMENGLDFSCCFQQRSAIECFLDFEQLLRCCWLKTVGGCANPNSWRSRVVKSELPIRGLHDLLLDLSLTATTAIMRPRTKPMAIFEIKCHYLYHFFKNSHNKNGVNHFDINSPTEQSMGIDVK